jgi:DNA-binding transcriptional ArsR family regulator
VPPHAAAEIERQARALLAGLSPKAARQHMRALFDAGLVEILAVPPEALADPGQGIGPRAVLYGRVSTQEQADTGTSLATQLAALRRRARECCARIVAECLDDGVSGTRLLTRSEIQRALGFFRTGQANLRMVPDVTRAELPRRAGRGRRHRDRHRARPAAGVDRGGHRGVRAAAPPGRRGGAGAGRAARGTGADREAAAHAHPGAGPGPGDGGHGGGLPCSATSATAPSAPAAR